MIIFYDNNYPIITLDIRSFSEIDYKTLKKNLEYIFSLSNSKQTYINLYIDLYDLKDYSMKYIAYIIEYITYLNKDKLKYINKVNIFVNKDNNTIFLKTIEYINNGLSDILINVEKISKKKIWK